MKTLKSIGAVFAGLVLIFALSTITDVLLEKTGMMKLPFADNPLWLMLVVVLYRNVYVTAGGFLAAKLAPSNPMKHVLILACIGTVLGISGAVMMWHEPPHWYPIALIILGWPSTWLGGKLHTRQESGQ
jgi:hypothetical protein